MFLNLEIIKQYKIYFKLVKIFTKKSQICETSHKNTIKCDKRSNPSQTQQKKSVSYIS